MTRASNFVFLCVGIVLGAAIVAIDTPLLADKTQLPADVSARWTQNNPKIILVDCGECQECKKRGVSNKKNVRSVIVGSVQYSRPGFETTYGLVAAALPDNKLSPEFLNDARRVFNSVDASWLELCNPKDFDKALKAMTDAK